MNFEILKIWVCKLYCLPNMMMNDGCLNCIISLLVYHQNECEISHNVGIDAVTDIFVQDCFIEMNGSIHNSTDRVPATRDEDKHRGAFIYDVRFEDGNCPHCKLKVAHRRCNSKF